MTTAVKNQIIKLAGHGFSYSVIRNATGYSNSTISKVLRKENAQLGNYRNGKSAVARDLIRRCEVAINECRRLQGLRPRRWR